MKLLHDLRRRRLFRLAGLYIVGAWISIEVASVLFPAWGIPDTALRYLVLAAVVCFPVALVFGWIFDITPQGIVRTRPAGPDDTVDLSLKKTDYAILVALAAVVILVVLGSLEQAVDQAGRQQTITGDEAPANSIAVLPFESTRPGDDAAMYAHGFAEELLHRIARLGTVRVMARTSSFAFRDSNLDPREITRALGVRYLLRGTVTRADDAIRLSVDLIDDKGFEAWSDELSGAPQDVLAVQDEIAGHVVRVVNRGVGATSIQPQQRTINPDAYRDYLIGNEYLSRRTADWQFDAARSFRAALAEQPDFAAARAGLAVALALNPLQSELTQSHEEAAAEAARALELAPDLAEAHAASGLVMLTADPPDLPAARTHLEQALRLDPTLSDAYNWLAGALAQLGLYAEADAVRERGLAIDPLNPPLVTNAADRLAAQGAFDRAVALRRKLLELPEPPGLAYWGLHIQYSNYDRIADAIYWAKQAALAYRGSRNQAAFFAIAIGYEQLGMSDEADYWIALLDRYHADPLGSLIRMMYMAKMRGDDEALARLIERSEQAGYRQDDQLPRFVRRRLGALYVSAGLLDQGIPLMEQALGVEGAPADDEASHEIVSMAFHLALAYGQIGDSSAADRLTRRAEALLAALRADGQYQDSPSEIELLVYSHIVNDDLENAAIALRKAIDAGWTNYYWFVNDPYLAEAARAPELRPLMDEALRKVEKERAVVMARDAADDFKARIEQLLELDQS